MTFHKWTTDEFDLVFDTNIHADTTWAEFCDEIDTAEVSYFYVSMNPDDIVNAIKEEQDIADALGLRFIEVLDIYIATY